MTDLAGLYKEGTEGVPTEMTVGELREQLANTEQYTEFYLHKYQRIAVSRALSQALSLIQVHILTPVVYCHCHNPTSGMCVYDH